MRQRFRALVAVTALGLGLGMPSMVSADPVFIDGRPDKGLHTWCYDGVMTLRSSMDAAMTRLREQTVVDTAYYATCDSHTDIRWVQGATPDPGLSGYTECRSYWANGQCDRWRITMSKAAMDRTANPSATYRSAHCHEIGHSLGVSHYTTLPGDDTVHSCMRNAFAPTGAAWEIRYGTHHKSVHINPWFS